MNIAVNVPSDENRIESLIMLLDEMITVIADENFVLDKGLPASRSKQLGRKIELASLLEQRMADSCAQAASIRSIGEAVRSKLLERINKLQTVTDDNVVKLRAAIEASQRRIDAVMSAIRAGISDSSTYAANGRTGGSAASCSANILA